MGCWKASQQPVLQGECIPQQKCVQPEKKKGVQQTQVRLRAAPAKPVALHLHPMDTRSPDHSSFGFEPRAFHSQALKNWKDPSVSKAIIHLLAKPLVWEEDQTQAQF